MTTTTLPRLGNLTTVLLLPLALLLGGPTTTTTTLVRAWTTPLAHFTTRHRSLLQRAQQRQTRSSMSTMTLGTTGTVSQESAAEPILATPESIAKVLSETTPLPKLLVFDLDATLWYPELYQIRQKHVPKVHQQIHLFQDVRPIFQALRQLENPPALAIASRTTKTKWAHQLLHDFEVESGLSLASLVTYKEIVPGSKKTHFAQLRQATGYAYSEMLFFDDDARLNLSEISQQLGVLSCHVPRGLDAAHFVKAVQKYRDLKAGHAAGHWMGYILQAENLGIALSQPQPQEGEILQGRVKFYSVHKRFGFVIDDATRQEFFFHESKVPAGMQLRAGDAVQFESHTDASGRPSAVILSSSSAQAQQQQHPTGPPNGATVRMPCFTMSQPFAALLLNGHKTVESRNNPMFQDVKPGTRVLLHCGRRDWHDLESYQGILQSQHGMTMEAIEEAGRLPQGFRKGNVVGVVTVGRTWKATDRERQGRDLQGRVLAPYDGVGKFCTEIISAQWLTGSFQARGNPGVFQMDIPVSCLPETKGEVS